MIHTFLFLLIFNATLVSHLFAQSGNGFTGVVYSIDGTPLSGANVVVQGAAHGDASDDMGYFQVDGLSPGVFKAEASLIGYKAAVQSVTLKVGQRARINFYLQPDTLLLAQITVTALKTQKGLSGIAPHLEMITRADIAQSNARTIVGLLQQVPGIYVKRYGNSGQQQTISIRGGEANQVLILIDGQRLANPQSGQASLNNIMLNNIERIEVLKGGASALFGSNAIAGVINIVTKSGSESKKPEVSLQQAVAAFGTRQLSLKVGQKITRFSYNVAVDWLKSVGDYEFVNVSRVSRPTQTRLNADFRSYTAAARFKWTLSKKSKIEMRTQLYDFSTGAPGEISNPTPTARSTDRRYLTNVSFTGNLTEKSLASLSANYDIFNNTFTDPERAFLNGANKNTSFGFNGRQSVQISPQHLITYGAEYQRDEVFGASIAGRPNRWSYSLFARGKSNFLNKSIGLYPAIRMDKFSGLATEVSPKLSIVLNDVLTHGLKFVADFGKSFRVPSFNSLFFISNVQVRSNPRLQPERADEFDFGLHYASKKSITGQFRVSGVFFHRKVNGSILWLPDFRFIWSPRNISRVVSRGMEFSLDWRTVNDKLKLNFNYTFNDSRFDLPGNQQPTPYRPRHVLNSELTWQIANFNVRFAQSRVSERFPNVAGTNAVPAYSLLDFTLSRNFKIAGLKFSPKFSLNNLLSKNYSVVSNFPMPGRAFRFSLTTTI